jgi:hypothetical protein
MVYNKIEKFITILTQNILLPEYSFFILCILNKLILCGIVDAWRDNYVLSFYNKHLLL